MDVFTLLRRDSEKVSSIYKQIQQGLGQLIRRNAIGYFEISRASWNSMQKSKICTSIASFSKQSPHATMRSKP